MNRLSRVFSLYDRASEQFRTPFFVATELEGIRLFSDIILAGRDKPNDIANHPDDYDMYYLGQWDAVEGKLIPADDKMLVMQGKQLALQIRAAQGSQAELVK